MSTGERGLKATPAPLEILKKILPIPHQNLNFFDLKNLGKILG